MIDGIDGQLWGIPPHSVLSHGQVTYLQVHELFLLLADGVLR